MNTEENYISGEMEKQMAEFDQELKKIGELELEGAGPSAPLGWICPRCGAGNSPFNTVCYCNMRDITVIDFTNYMD